MDGGAWWAAVHGVAKSRTRLSDFPSLLEFLGFPSGSECKESACNAGDLGSIPGSDPLEKEMATCSSILAWRNPWTEKPGRLQSMGYQRVWTG